MSECAKCKRHEDIRPHGAGGVCFSCATIAELTKELETVREVSSNRLKLWMDVCKERDGLRERVKAAEKYLKYLEDRETINWDDEGWQALAAWKQSKAKSALDGEGK